MSELPTDPASLKIKRMKALVWPFATRTMCEEVGMLLSKDELVRELFPPEEWRIHSSTDTRGKRSQHERKLWVKNDLNSWMAHRQDLSARTRPDQIGRKIWL